MKNLQFAQFGQPFYQVTDGAGGTGDGTGAADDAIKVTLTDVELEERITSRVNAALAIAQKRFAKQGGVTTEQQAELDALKKEKAERDRIEAERKGEYEKAKTAIEKSIRDEFEPKLTDAQKREQALLEKYRARTITESLVAAAAKLNAFDAGQVKKLLADNVKLNDELEPQVVDDAGNPRFVGGKEMTIDQLVQEFLNKNPNLVRNVANNGGSGASGGRTSTTGDTSPIAEAEAALKAAESEYKKTRSEKALLAVGVASKALREAKSGQK